MSDPISDLFSQFKGAFSSNEKKPDLSGLFGKCRSPASDLLLALRPYLNEKRRKKVKEAVGILSLTQVFELFKTFGGE